MIRKLLTCMVLCAAALLGTCGCSSGSVQDGADTNEPETESADPSAAPPPGDPEKAADYPPPSSPRLGDELSAVFRLISQNRLPEARTQLETLLAANPDDAKAVFMLGLTWHRQKVYGKARPLFERAVELDPGYFTTYHFLGWCLYYLGEPDLAREAFLAHVHYEPQEGDSHFALGLIAFERGELDEAEQYFLHSIDLQINDPRRHQGIAKSRAALADVYLQRGQLEEARTELVIATDLWPDAYEAYYKLYRVLLQLGEEGAAAYALERHNEAKERLRPGTSFPE